MSAIINPNFVYNLYEFKIGKKKNNANTDENHQKKKEKY